MNAEGLATTLTALAQFKAPYLIITIKNSGTFYNGQVMAVHRGKVLGTFGNRLRATLPELKRAICDYLTFEFEIQPSKRLWIEAEIKRLDEKAKKAIETKV